METNIYFTGSTVHDVNAEWLVVAEKTILFRFTDVIRAMEFYLLLFVTFDHAYPNHLKKSLQFIEK